MNARMITVHKPCKKKKDFSRPKIHYSPLRRKSGGVHLMTNLSEKLAITIVRRGVICLSYPHTSVVTLAALS